MSCSTWPVFLHSYVCSVPLMVEELTALPLNTGLKVAGVAKLFTPVSQDILLLLASAPHISSPLQCLSLFFLCGEHCCPSSDNWFVLGHRCRSSLGLFTRYFISMGFLRGAREKTLTLGRVPSAVGRLNKRCYRPQRRPLRSPANLPSIVNIRIDIYRFDYK